MLDLFNINLNNFNPNDYPVDVRGWGSDAPIFAELIERVRPQRIIEVGTWKGASALHMASICAQLGLPTKLICVDTWLGAYEFIGADGERDLMRLNGFPQVYYQFLANVARAGFQDRIFPFPQTSLIAARWLFNQGIQADLIYVDGSHDVADVAADIVAYVPLLRPRGVLFGDDFDTWAGVRQAVEDCGYAFDIRHDRYWVLK